VDWLLFSLLAWGSLSLPRGKMTEKADSIIFTGGAYIESFQLANSISMTEGHYNRKIDCVHRQILLERR
jgi:hypothetical protein